MSFLPGSWCAQGVGMVGRAVRGSLDPLRREADSHTRQGKVLMCPSEEELEVSFQEAVTAGLGVG